MVNDLRRRLKALEGATARLVAVSAADIAAAVARYSASGVPTGCPSADAFGVMLRSMRPSTAVLFFGCDPEDLLL